MIIRQNYKLTVLFIVVFLSACCSARPDLRRNKDRIESEARFKIIQINDVYKIEGLEGGRVGGIARVRTLRKQLEEEGAKVLVLHAGDILFPSVMSKYLRAQPMVKTLNLLDGNPAAFDRNFIAVFGNHEFDDKDPGLILGRVAQSDFLWVSSNVQYRSTKESTGEPFSHRLKNVHDTIVLDVDGVRIGIFGLTIDSKEQDYVSYIYEDIETRHAAIRAAIDRLKSEGTRMIIALTHQDLEQDKLLASEFSEIDLIVGGHEHFFIQQKVGNTWIMKADSDAKSAIVYDVRISDETVKVIPQKIKVGQEIVKDVMIDSEVQYWLTELSKTVKEQKKQKEQKDYDLMDEIGYTKYTLEGIEPAVRGRESALGNFLTDVIRDRLKTDLAFINGGSIRINDNIPPGPIRNYDMEGIFYFDNNLVSFELTGAEILDILRNSVSKVHLGDGRFLQVSGIKFTYHVDRKAGEMTYRIEPEDVFVWKKDGGGYVPLNPDQKYTVGTTDYMWEHGHEDGYKIFSGGDNGQSPKLLPQDQEIPFREAVEGAIKTLSDQTVTTQVEGRIIEEQE